MRWIYAVVLLASYSVFYAEEINPLPQVVQNCCNVGSLNEKLSFESYGRWLYLQPNGSNLYYAAEAFPYDTSIADPPASPNWQIFELSPSFHSGFDVGIRFLLPEINMGFSLAWERLHASDTNSMNVTPLAYGTGNMVGPIYDIGPNSAAYKSAKGKGVFHFDDVSLLVEKSICVVPDLTVDLNLGVSYAKIEQEICSFYTNTSTTSRKIDTRSSYWGIGPQFDFHLSYQIYQDFYFTGQSTSSIYLGKIKNTAHYQSSAPTLATVGVAQPNTQQTVIPHRTQLIPGLEEKLGLGYKKAFQNCHLSIEAGYLFQIYLNAVQSMDMLTQAVPDFDPGQLPDNALFALTFNRTLSNFMLSGPYVSLDIGF